MCDHHQCSESEQQLANQAQNQLNLALYWLAQKNLEASNAFLFTVKKLLILSGASKNEAWINYYYARGAIAESRGHPKAALHYSRKSLAAARKIHPETHYVVLQAQANLGDSLAALGQKEKGRALIADSLEKFRAIDVGSEANRLAWKENIVRQLEENLQSVDAAG